MTMRFLIIALIFILSFVFVNAGQCDDPMKKLGRGACNVVTCPLEIFEQMKRVNNSEGPFASITYGLLKGIGMTGVRAVVGVYEIATFPIPFPKNYRPILKDPEFFFEETFW